MAVVDEAVITRDETRAHASDSKMTGNCDAAKMAIRAKVTAVIMVTGRVLLFWP